MEGKDDDMEEGDGELELSLGLSLHGRFGVDPIRTKIKITKSASIANFLTLPGDDGNESTAFSPALQNNGVNLLRTCSLPAESEEERRRRKDMQMLRRMVAKRKRSEKQLRTSKVKDRCGSSGDMSALIEEEGGHVNGGLVKPSSQGSIGSQVSGSSGLSETDSLHAQDHEMKPIINHVTASRNNGSGDPGHGGANLLEEMPHVSTRGLGPTGRRIEGFLYQYRKGEEVRIVCVCHGSFHTPSEFVRHAGGGDVAHPLRHIVVNPNPLL